MIVPTLYTVDGEDVEMYGGSDTAPVTMTTHHSTNSPRDKSKSSKKKKYSLPTGT